MKILSWNIARRDEAWRVLAGGDADIALLQEATPPPPDVHDRFAVDPAPWRTEGTGRRRQWRTAIARMSQRVAIDWIESAPLVDALPHQLGISRLGTLTAARVASEDLGETVTVISMYGLWEHAHELAVGRWIYADASVHRLISDLSGLVGRRDRHRIIAAGDLNILFGYGERGNRYWAARYGTIFERLASLGLIFVGPQAPEGRQAEPWPDELPRDSRNVPTYYINCQGPALATRQLDFVFASETLADRITVRALNDPGCWGPSDHCRLEIALAAVR
jgi:hypothetical protein